MADLIMQPVDGDRDLEAVAANIIHQVGDALYEALPPDVAHEHFVDARQATNDLAIDFAKKLISGYARSTAKPVGASADAPGVEWFALPDAELVFGLGSGSCHAVTHEAAVESIGGGAICDATAVSLCGELVGLAAGWGAYERNSRYLKRSDICHRCVWIAAAARGELAAQIAYARAEERHERAVVTALGDSAVGERLLRAIVADPDIAGSLAGRFSRSHCTDLLALAAQHLPGVLVCDECGDDFDDAHQGRACPIEAAGCLTCSPTAGPYAGEWEGAMLQECVVQAPCSVLRALCDYYEIKLPDPTLTQ